jgi:hypothetical protein
MHVQHKLAGDNPFTSAYWDGALHGEAVAFSTVRAGERERKIEREKRQRKREKENRQRERERKGKVSFVFQVWCTGQQRR